MDFARKQLEKYGWTDGKGLGKNENGISEALKPKLKRSVAGIGHDAAADFTEHWWTQLYNKAAKNVEILEKNGKTKKIKRKDNNDFEITNSTWKMNRKRKQKQNGVNADEGYSDYFVKKAVLANGSQKLERTTDSDSDEEKLNKDVYKMTDEELFAACGGRTAHKGARHGLKATGKLARIAQQEQMLLKQPQYNGYSHTKNITDHDEELICDQIIEDANMTDENHSIKKDRKKKKKKRCISHTNEHCMNPLPEDIDKEMSENVAIMDVDNRHSAKNKKTKKEKLNDDGDDQSAIKSKKTGMSQNYPLNNDELMDIEPEKQLMKCKRKKRNK